MHERLSCIIIYLCLLFTISCCRKGDERLYSCLLQWDGLLQGQPEAIRDSLATLHPEELSQDNWAYYGLLKTIADDKTYVDFTSDSLINSVESYYRKHAHGSNHHIRSLIYQGIVRSRKGITDSTMYQPLKEALRILYKQKDPDPTLLYLTHYFMGDIHKKNGNKDIAQQYFQKALISAKLKKDRSHIFDAYLSLFWNSLAVTDDLSGSKFYLDTLQLYVDNNIEKEYFLLNAESMYADLTQNYEEAIEKEKKKLDIYPSVRIKGDEFRIYYALSDIFSRLNKPDSAFFYARQAIAHIEDPAYLQNYLLYNHAADIAVGMDNYRLADDYRRQALSAYDQSVEKRLDTRIRELEIRYDLAESENKALKAEAQNRLMLAIGGFVLLLAGILTLYFAKQRSIVLLQREKLAAEKEHTEAEKRRSDAEAQLLRQQAKTQQELLSHYVSFLEIYASQLNQTRILSKKIHSRDVKLGEEFDLMLKRGRQRFHKLAETMLTPGDMTELFGIGETEGVLTENDRLMLSMLAAGAANKQIAALLSTSTNNLKSKKWYLKKKIAAHATADNGFEQLLEILGRR
ncbi:Tetratricopeptide repeat-containing protein [Porphyromonadaceae bacterium KH3CP3RA]|nr:Tetratricopeptide repeat-containing protein [Porphyromonadaceae bacterium KH3CP3RA]